MVLRVLRLARIVRIAKLSRHSRNLNTLIKTMSTSLRELSFLMLFFIVSMVLYATFAYYCEQNAEATGVSYIFSLNFKLTLTPKKSSHTDASDKLSDWAESSPPRFDWLIAPF